MFCQSGVWRLTEKLACVNNGDGTVTDWYSRKTWYQNASGYGSTFYSATLHGSLAALTTYGRRGWRLPALGEIAEVVARCGGYFSNVQNAQYGSTTPYGYTGTYSYIYAINPLTNAVTTRIVGGIDSMWIWPVRDGT